MKEEVAKAWVAALRSGKYRQGRERLRTSGDLFCCLGVLCDISGLAQWETIDGALAMWYLDKSDVLPPAVMDWSGLQSQSGVFRPDGKNTISLVALNDDVGVDFPMMAGLIEKYWQEL